jgi:hypothetical protein
MGLSHAVIRFPLTLPSFSAISHAYEQQTGLGLRLIATVQLPPQQEIISAPAALGALLAADAAAVTALTARHDNQQAPLLQAGRYDQAAAMRDQQRAALGSLTHLSNLAFVVGNGEFYPIEFAVDGQNIIINQYHNQYYAVVSLLQVLRALGGTAESAAPHRVPAGRPEERKLKRWSVYKWYNRPRK